MTVEERKEKKRARDAARYANNREAILAQQAVWRAENPDKCRAMRNAWRAENPGKVRDIRARWDAANPDKVRAKYRRSTLKRYAGITPEQYIDALAAAEGCCELCGRHVSTLTRSLAADHCHTSGRFRGVLCPRCNTGLGIIEKFLADPTKTLAYLKRGQE